MMLYLENRTNGLDTRELVIGLRKPVTPANSKAKTIAAAIIATAVFIGFMQWVMP